MTTTREQVLAVLTERDGELPDDGVTLEKISVTARTGGRHDAPDA